MRLPSLCSLAVRPLALACLLSCPLFAQQRVALPHGTGSLAPASGWTVLAGPDLAAAARPTDPADEPARTLLLGAIDALRASAREVEHVLLHRPGTAAGTLRLVNAYSAEGRAFSATLAEPASAETIRKALEQHLATPGVTVKYLGASLPRLTTVGGVAVSFEVHAGDHTWILVHHVLPAGERIQYFETMYFPGDPDAPGELDSLLRTFDGAREPPASSILRNMTYGGLAGGAAGVLMALLRRRQQQRRAAGSAQASR